MLGFFWRVLACLFGGQPHSETHHGSHGDKVHNALRNRASSVPAGTAPPKLEGALQCTSSTSLLPFESLGALCVSLMSPRSQGGLREIHAALPPLTKIPSASPRHELRETMLFQLHVPQEVFS